MLPASGFLRPAPAWLRFLVVVGLGVLLLSPLLPYGRSFVRHLRLRGAGLSEDDRARLARGVATRFLQAWLENDDTALPPLLPQKVAPSMPARMGNICLGPVQASLFVPEIDAIDHKENTTFVDFHVRYRPGDVTLLVKPDSAAEERRLIDEIEQVAQSRNGSAGRLDMGWEDGSWRVRSVAYPVGADGQGPQYSFSMLIARTPDVSKEKTLQNLNTISAGDFDKGWRRDLEARDEQAGPLLRRLQKDAGMSALVVDQPTVTQLPRLPPGTPAVEEWEQKHITLSLKQRSGLEIMDRVARLAGLEVHQTDRGLVPAKGDQHPVAGFAGPFRVEADGVVEDDPRHATGSLHLDALAVNLPEAVLDVLDGWKPFLPDPDVRGMKGQDLYYGYRSERLVRPQYRVVNDFGARTRNRFVRLRWQVPLRNLVRDVTHIRSFRGNLLVPLPARIDTGRLLLVGEKGTARIGPAELTWQRNSAVGGSGTIGGGIHVSAATSKPCRVYYRAIDDTGKTWSAGVLDSAGVSVQPFLPAVEIKVCTTEEVRFPFELNDIPLENRAPTQLSPVEFPGKPAPLSFTASVLQKGSYNVLASNHTRKAVEELRFTFHCLDAAGKEVGKLKVVHPPVVRQDKKSPSITYGRGPGVVTPASTRPTHAIEAASIATIYPKERLPAGTARLEVELVRVLFCDGTTWSPAGR